MKFLNFFIFTFFLISISDNNKQKLVDSVYLEEPKDIFSNCLNYLPVTTPEPYKTWYDDGWLYYYLSNLIKLNKNKSHKRILPFMYIKKRVSV